jgi:hypothetical protein
MKRIFWNSLVLVALCLLAACRGERWDDDLTLPQQNYFRDELRIDGYYYSLTSNNNYQIYFYYKNGCVLNAGVVSSQALSEKEASFADGTFYNTAIKYKQNWGRFIIEGSIIKDELWKPNTGPLEAFTTQGKIINDSTFVMQKSWRSCKPKKVREFEETFHFKRFSPKPDSTNTFTH